MFRSYIREKGHGKFARRYQNNTWSQLLCCYIWRKQRPGRRVQMFKSLFNIQSFRNASAADVNQIRWSCSSSWMVDGCRGLRRWWSHFALTMLKTPPSVSMVTGSTLHWQHIPCGKQRFAVQPRLIFPIEHADIWLCLFAHKKFADVSEQTRERGTREDGEIKSEGEMFYGFKVISTQIVRGKNISHPPLSLFNLTKKAMIVKWGRRGQDYFSI